MERIVESYCANLSVRMLKSGDNTRTETSRTLSLLGVELFEQSNTSSSIITVNRPYLNSCRCSCRIVGAEHIYLRSNMEIPVFEELLVLESDDRFLFIDPLRGYLLDGRTMPYNQYHQ